MVGLYWERVIDSDGEERFDYICSQDESRNNKVDTFLFWTTQYGSSGYWIVIAVWKLITLSSVFFVTLVPAVLSCFNLYAFYNCSDGK